MFSIDHIVYPDSLGIVSCCYQRMMGTFEKSVFADASQGLTVSAGLSKDNSLRSAFNSFLHSVL